MKKSGYILVLCMALLVGMPCLAQADDALPQAVVAQIHEPLQKVGSGVYRKFGFSVYRATLWAPNGMWDADKPYALSLVYLRSVSKDTLVDTVADDIRDQNVTDDETLVQWRQTLSDVLPAVEDGDTIVGVSLPGKGSSLFLNGKKIGAISNRTFSQAFFNIWLGDGADEDLRAKLTGVSK